MNSTQSHKKALIIRASIAVLIIALVIFMGIAITDSSHDNEELSSHGDAPDGYDAFAAAVDTEFCLALAQQISSFGNDPVTGYRTSGSPAEASVAELLEQTMKDIGLQNVTVDEVSVDGWTFYGASISYDIYDDSEQSTVKVDLGVYPIGIKDDNVATSIVYVNNGYATEYEKIDVSGKIVLIEVDSDEAFRVDFPVYQAYLKEAKAVILVNKDETIENRMVNRDLQGLSVIPVFAISRNAADDLIKAIEESGYDQDGTQQIDAYLSANNNISNDAITRNVWGEIPGESDEVIYFSTHYDGLYYSFFDGSTEVGLIMGIAKAMVESGYKPQKTIRFVMNGAGEWGKAGALRNRNVGASEQVTTVYPDWPESIFTLFSINCGLPFQDSKQLKLSVPFEFESYIKSTIESFGDRSKNTKISVAGELPPVGRSDAVYRSIGIPTVTTDRSKDASDYFQKMYHSNGDVYFEKGYNRELAESIILYYGYSSLMFDELLIKPFNLENRFVNIKESYDVENEVELNIDSHLLANVDRAIDAAAQLDRIVASINAAYLNAKDEKDQVLIEEFLNKAPEIALQLNKVYKLIQDNFYELNINMEYEFGHEELQNNIILLNSTIKHLEDGKPELAVETISGINLSSYTSLFDLETCDYLLERAATTSKTTWDSSLEIDKLCNVNHVISSMNSKIEDKTTDFDDEIIELERIKEEQTEIIKKLYSAQGFALSMITEEIYRVVDSNR